MNTNIPVFVYGSLLRGLCNNSILSVGREAEYGGEFLTTERGAMVSLGAFPGVVMINHMPSYTYQKHEPIAATILGEVYWVTSDMLDTLDRLEGTPDFYRRIPVGVRPWRLSDNIAIGTKYDIEVLHSESGDSALRKNEVWMYEINSQYLESKNPLVKPLRDISYQATLYWKYEVTGKRPELSQTYAATRP